MLIVKRHPIGEKEVIEVAPNRAVIEYLTDYDDRPDIEVDVYLNGGELLEEKDYKRILKESDILTLSYRPGGVEVAVAAVIAVVAAVVLVSLIPKPEVPNVVGETSSSPNNSVSGQTNTVRKYEATPNIYGRVTAYPDLIANAVPEWISNRKQVRELFLIGDGEYQINEIRDGATDINEIEESSATIYGPNTFPDNLYRVKFSSEVNDEEVIAPNDNSLIWSGTAGFANNVALAFTSSSASTFTAPSTLVIDYSDEYNGLDLSVGEAISISGTTLNNGSYTIASISNIGNTRTITFSELTISDESAGGGTVITFTRSRIACNSILMISDLGITSGDSITTGYLEGPYTVDGFDITTSQTFIYLVDSQSFSSTTGEVSTTLQKESAGTINIIGPFTMPTTAEQIWFNLSARNGLQSNTGESITVSVTVYAQEIDEFGADVGAPISQQVDLTGKTTKTVGKTVKLTELGGKRYDVYAIRTTNRYSGSAIQDVFWEEVFTVNSYSGENFGNVTVMDVTTKAALNGTTSSRKINVDVTRKLNGAATMNFADAVKDLIVNKGRRPESEIDLVGLYDIADGLSDDLKEFSFTFDDKNISLAQAVQTACNVARVNVYRDGQTWRFNRDEAKPRTYVFNRRNLASGDNQRFTQRVRLPNDYDSVALRYYNRDLESFDDVLIRIDVNTQSFIVGEDGSRPYQIELAGCSNYAQALNRAQLEARKIVYLRRSVEDVALIDAASVDIGDRVAWCDIYDGDTMDGEITGRDGNIFYTSENIELTDGVKYFAMITDSNGQAMTPVEVSAVAGNKKSFEAAMAGEVIVADGVEIQAGSKYIIGDVNDIDDTDYTVVGRGSNEGGRISIELIQYSDSIYEND